LTWGRWRRRIQARHDDRPSGNATLLRHSRTAARAPDCGGNVSDDDFPEAVKKLQARAETSYELTSGKYTEGAKSPAEGAKKKLQA
jgi:hypothetical protein